MGPAGGNIGSAPINSSSVNSFLKLTATRTTITASEMIATGINISVRLPIDALSIRRKVRSATRITLLNDYTRALRLAVASPRCIALRRSFLLTAMVCAGAASSLDYTFDRR